MISSLYVPHTPRYPPTLQSRADAAMLAGLSDPSIYAYRCLGRSAPQPAKAKQTGTRIDSHRLAELNQTRPDQTRPDPTLVVKSTGRYSTTLVSGQEYRPVILNMPFVPRQPLSPECSQPSASIASAVFFSISATCAFPSFGFARYPIMMCRPRKHSSPCSASAGRQMSAVRAHSCFAPEVPTAKTFVSLPKFAKPQLPHTWAESVDHVVCKSRAEQ